MAKEIFQWILAILSTVGFISLIHRLKDQCGEVDPPDPNEPPEPGAEPGAEPKGVEPTPGEPEPEPELELEPEPGEGAKRKTGAEKRIDELTAKRRQAERDADYWRNEAMKRGGEPPAKPDEKTPETLTRPKPEESQYETFDKYNEALVDWKIEQKEVGREAARSKTDQQERSAKFQEKLNEGFEKHEDFREIALNPNVPINQNMVDALFDSDHAADIAYHLGQNPQEARRIASLSPIAAAREIGKLEARFSGPPQKTKTKAPDATKPVGDKEAIPKKYDEMTEDDASGFIAQRNKEELESLTE